MKNYVSINWKYPQEIYLLYGSVKKLMLLMAHDTVEFLKSVNWKFTYMIYNKTEIGRYVWPKKRIVSAIMR